MGIAVRNYRRVQESRDTTVRLLVLALRDERFMVRADFRANVTNALEACRSTPTALEPMPFAGPEPTLCPDCRRNAEWCETCGGVGSLHVATERKAA